jgi:hypothetical protein
VLARSNLEGTGPSCPWGGVCGCDSDPGWATICTATLRSNGAKRSMWTMWRWQSRLFEYRGFPSDTGNQESGSIILDRATEGCPGTALLPAGLSDGPTHQFSRTGPVVATGVSSLGGIVDYRSSVLSTRPCLSTTHCSPVIHRQLPGDETARPNWASYHTNHPTVSRAMVMVGDRDKLAVQYPRLFATEIFGGP